jgi:hypothetical protein
MVIVIGALVFFDVRELTGNVLFIIFFIPFMIAGYFLMAQRLRDFNVTGWLVLFPPRYPAWVAACPWVESPTPIPLFDRGPSLRPDLRIWQAAGRSGGQGGPKAIAAAAATCP